MVAVGVEAWEGRELENTKISSAPKRAQDRHFHIRHEQLFGFGSPRPVLGRMATSCHPDIKHGYVFSACNLMATSATQISSTARFVVPVI